MGLLFSRHIKPQTGTAFELPAGQVLRVIDPEGEQVSDVALFRPPDFREQLSAGRTVDYTERTWVTTGERLYSNLSEAIATVVADTCGRHDLLLAPCSTETFRLLRGFDGHHPNCFDNLAGPLEEFGVPRAAIADSFNVFMTVDVLPTGEVKVLAPSSKAGDYVDIRAEVDLVVGVTACSSEATNNGQCKRIEIEVYEP